MDALDAEVLAAARRWGAAGHHFALLTVARTWGSAPRPAGAWMAVRDDGRIAGSVSGGCVEDDLIRRMQAGEFAPAPPRTLRYGVDAEAARQFGLPCGGTLELVLETAPDPLLLDELGTRTGAGQLVLRCVDLDQGGTRLLAGQPEDRLNWDGQRLVTVHGPQWRLLLIGAGQISRFLAPMAQTLGYQVRVCDPRSEYGDEWQVPGVARVAGMPDDAVLAMGADARSAVVALTHDPKLDDLALLEALKSPAFYVGALGSRANNAKRRTRLLQYFDLGADQVARLHGPVGLAIGSRTPAEIAIAILAEMTAVKNGVALPPHSRSADLDSPPRHHAERASA